jgi:hypothetical protein
MKNTSPQLEKGLEMTTDQAKPTRPSGSKRLVRKSPLMVAAAALLAAAAIAAAGCGGGYGSSPAPAGSASPAPSAQDKADGDTDGGHGASDVQAAPSSSAGIPQNNGGDHDADNNGGPSDGDGQI